MNKNDKRMAIEIKTVNYFGESDNNEFNAKVLYSKYGKSYVANIQIDYFWKRIYIPKNQFKENKVLTGLEQAVTEYIFKGKCDTN